MREYVHNSAAGGAKAVGLAVFYADVAFSVGGRHAENPGQPAPEYGAGTSERDGGGNADDIAGAERGGKRGGKGFEKMFSVGACGQADGERKLFLDKMQTQRKVEMDAE